MSKNHSMKRAALIHPFLFALASVLFLYLPASATIDPTQTIRPIAVLFILLSLLIYPAYRITKDWDYTGIALTTFVFGFYCEQTVFMIFLVSSAGILILWTLFLRLRRKKGSIEEVTLQLNILSTVLLLSAIIKLISLFVLIPSSYYEDFMFSKERMPIASLETDNIKPDIYYIVLDGYANSDVLNDLYNFDNADFTGYLEDKGFIIPDETHSNYAKTSLSIPSTLNMDYVQNFAPGLEQSYFWWLMMPYIHQSQAHLLLRANGYETVSLATDWTITNNKSTDIYYQPSSIQLSEFENHIISNSGLKLLLPIVEKIVFVPSLNSHRDLVLFNLEKLSRIPESQQPQFIFVHIVSPHPPFVFDKNGHKTDPNRTFTTADAQGFVAVAKNKGLETEDEIRTAYREGYIQQVQFLNKKLIQAIDDILKRSNTPPIIIFQSDHGSGLLTDFKSTQRTCLNERFSPFAAYYLPNVNPNDIPSDITPVNLFRIIFNEYFETNLPLLENQYFFSTDPSYVYQFEEVSLQQIKAACQP